MEDVKLGEPQVCPACKALNPAGLYLPFECLKCAEIPKEKKDNGSKVPCSVGLSLLLEKWRARSSRFEKDYQFGRDGKDDNTYVHGKCDMLDECIDELMEAIKG